MQIVAVSARRKARGQGPGTGYGESGKRGVWITLTGPKWKKWGVWKKNNRKTVFVNKYLPYQWLWTKCRQRHASLPILQRKKV